MVVPLVRLRHFELELFLDRSIILPILLSTLLDLLDGLEKDWRVDLRGRASLKGGVVLLAQGGSDGWRRLEGIDLN